MVYRQPNKQNEKANQKTEPQQEDDFKFEQISNG